MGIDRLGVVRIGDMQLVFIMSEPSATVFEFIVPAHAKVPDLAAVHEIMRRHGVTPA